MGSRLGCGQPPIRLSNETAMKMDTAPGRTGRAGADAVRLTVRQRLAAILTARWSMRPWESVRQRTRRTRGLPGMDIPKGDDPTGSDLLGVATDAPPRVERARTQAEGDDLIRTATGERRHGDAPAPFRPAAAPARRAGWRDVGIEPLRADIDETNAVSWIIPGMASSLDIRRLCGARRLSRRWRRHHPTHAPPPAASAGSETGTRQARPARGSPPP